MIACLYKRLIGNQSRTHGRLLSLTMSKSVGTTWEIHSSWAACRPRWLVSDLTLALDFNRPPMAYRGVETPLPPLKWRRV